MNRLLVLLLIPVFVFGQSFCHLHAGVGIAEIDEPTSHPHFHLHSHAHHHQVEHGRTHGAETHQHDASDDQPESRLGDQLSPLADHDSDAIYFVASDSMPLNGRSFSANNFSTNGCVFADEVIAEPQVRYRLFDPPDRFVRCPLYLLKSSLLL